MRRPRVLYLQPAASFGGAERQAAQAVRLLPEFGLEVVPVVGPGRQIVDFLEDAGVTSYRFRRDLPDDPKAPRSALARTALLSGYVRAYFRLVHDLTIEVRRLGCDLLFASRPFAWVIAGEVGARLGIPVIWRAGTGFEHWTHPIVLRMYASHHPPRAMVYTSSAVMRGLSGVMRAPAFVVHNGVDTARFHPGAPVSSLRLELGIAAQAPVVGFVARLSPEKGIDRLLEVCRRLQARRPDAKVLVAGDSGWRAGLEAACRGPLAGMVRMLGFVREVERVYATADVIVSTSTAEGCPNAVLEAMAMGRTVLATRVGGTSEIVRDGIDGVLMDPDDPARFAATLEELLGDAARRERLGRAAARRVAESFSVRAQVQRLARIIRWTIEAPLGEPPEETQPEGPPPGVRVAREGDARIAARAWRRAVAASRSG